jgi:hypothetical protein
MSNLKLEYYEGLVTVSRARSGSNVATIIVNEAHGLITGDTVTITGLGGTGYNAADVSVTVTNSTTFTYANTGSSEGTAADTGGRVAATMVFPYNPNSVEFATSKFVDQRNLPYYFTFLGFTSPIKSSITIALNGHFDGTTKNTDYRNLVRKVNSPKMLKLYFENNNNKFYLCTGATVQKVPTGTRPLHTDYVANFFSPFGILFDATQQSGAYNSSNKNDGDIIIPIETITGSVTSGAAVTIKDKNNNGFTFTPSGSGTMTYKIIKITSGDNTTYLSEYMHVEVGGVTQIIQNASVSGDLILKLNPGESLNDIFAAGTITGITATFYFRNGWSSD